MIDDHRDELSGAQPGGRVAEHLTGVEHGQAVTRAQPLPQAIERADPQSLGHHREGKAARGGAGHQIEAGGVGGGDDDAASPTARALDHPCGGVEGHRQARAGEQTVKQEFEQAATEGRVHATGHDPRARDARARDAGFDMGTAHTEHAADEEAEQVAEQREHAQTKPALRAALAWGSTAPAYRSARESRYSSPFTVRA